MRVILPVLFLLLGACRPATLGPTCEDHEHCAAEDGCLAGRCVPAECREPGDCLLGETCRELQCEPGCSTAADCFSGETCEEGTCVEASCVETAMDCPAARDCVDGSCTPRPGVCRPCALGGCPDDLVCVQLTSPDGVCLPRCRESTDCPASFTCFPLEDRGVSVCASDCEYLQAHGWVE